MSDTVETDGTRRYAGRAEILAAQRAAQLIRCPICLARVEIMKGRVTIAHVTICPRHPVNRKAGRTPATSRR